MSGLSELDEVRVISAAPERIRVSVFGGRTQLDIALPLDIPVSGFVPDLARLVRSRDVPHDDEDPAAKDQRRTFWVLSRFDTGAEVRPDQTLREAGVVNGQLLRLSSRRALSPPTLYDDVVDAAARLNKAAYAAWDARSARWLAFAGTHLAAAAFAFCLVHPAFAAQRAVIVGVAAVVAVALAGVAAVAHRSYGLDDVAAVMGWAAIPITAAIAWVVLTRFGNYGVAAACAVVLVLNFVYYRVIGTGHWAYVATSVVAGLGGVAVLSHAVGLRVDVVCVTLAVTATLTCLVIPRLTARLDRFETPTVNADADRDEYAFENPFESPASAKPSRDDDSGAAMPTAEAVWAKVHSAALTRSALLTGLAATAAAANAVLLRDAGVVRWAAFAFALTCSAVLGLRSRVPDTWVERAGLAVPAVVLVAITCAIAQNGLAPIPVVALGVVLAIAVGAVVAGLSASGGRLQRPATLLAYLEYVGVAALLPLALWVVGVYERLGPWW
ncbi:type VII secretion integral membrane protein EccD [Mycobacterium talmoniae]|nr:MULTISPECIES: type VII secretion integral membrane protein EccD [Mycobacterium]